MTPREIQTAQIDPNVYDSEQVFDHCLVRVIYNPYDPLESIIDWCKMSNITHCTYPAESIIEMIEDVQVRVLSCSENGKTSVMWKRYTSQEDKTVVDMSLYDSEEWLEHQTVDVYYPVMGEGDAILDYYPMGQERVVVFCGYVKAETYHDVRVQVLKNSLTGKTSAAWCRYPLEDF